MNNKYKILFLSVTIILIGCILIKNKSYSYPDNSSLTDNSIIVGEKIFNGYVNPNKIMLAAVEYYDNYKDENVIVYKYNGKDIYGNNIWGKYDSEKDCYIELTDEEKKAIEQRIGV